MRRLLTGTLLVLLSNAAYAQVNTAEPPPAAEVPLTAPEDSARYSFNRVGDEFIRLDKTTGQVSRCTQRSAGWSCQPSPEERAAFESEIARLQDENAALRRQLADASPAAKPPGANPKGYRVPDAQLRLPTNEDIDRALTAAGKVWQRLMRMLNDVRSDMAEKI